MSVTKGGIVPQMENVAKSDATDNRKKVLSGDFVINSRSDRKQSCGVSLIDGSVSLINTVLYPAKGAPIIQTYLNYLLKNYGFAEEFYRWGHGIVADLWTTRWQEMKSILIPVPPMDEQRKILNAASAQIDSLIEIIQTQIERLMIIVLLSFQVILAIQVFGILNSSELLTMWSKDGALLRQSEKMVAIGRC